MGFFKSEKEKEVNRYQDERDRDYEQRRKEAEQARREDEENRKEREEYISELEEELTDEDNTTIITIHLCNDEYAWRKQIVLNFMFKHGYICVQNDVCCSRYTLHHDLTFVKKENADFFKI